MSETRLSRCEVGLQTDPYRHAPLARRHLLLRIFGPLLIAGCSHAPRPKQRVDLYIQTRGDLLEYRPDELTCQSGALVVLTFHHAGRFVTVRHDWMLTYPGKLEALSKELLDNYGVFSKNDPRIIAVTPLCDKGGTVMVQFAAPPPGDYPFLCSTHPEDMRGILHVTK